MPSRGPKGRRKGYITPAFSRVPNKGAQNQKWPPHPCLLRGPKEGRNATSPLHSQGSPTKGNKIKSGCLNPAFSGAQKRAEMLRHPFILGGPQQRETKSEVAVSPMPSPGPKRGPKCYVTPTFSGVTNKGKQNQQWVPQPCLLRGPKEGGNATSCPSFSGVPQKGEQNQKWLPQCRLLLCPKEGRNATLPLHSQVSPTKGNKIRSGPQQRGTKSEVAASPMPSPGPKRGRKCYVSPTFSGVTNKGGQNHKWLPHPYLLRGPKEGGNATSPLHSRGSPTKGNKTRRGCLTHAFPGAQKRAEMLHHPYILGSPTEGNKIIGGYLNAGFSGAQQRAEMRHRPCILGCPQQRGTKLEVVPTKGNAIKSGCLTHAFSGAQKRAEMLRHLYILRGHLQRRTKSKVAASPLAFSGAQKRAEMLCHTFIIGGPQQRGTKS